MYLGDFVWPELSTDRFNAISVALALFQLGAIWFAASNINQQKKQIKAIRKQVELQTDQVRLQREEVFVTSFAHFSTLYHSIMNNIPEADASDDQIRRWWYSYWDLVIAEVSFCMRGYLDRMMFELWMHELVRNFMHCPHGATYMGTFADSAANHLVRVLGQHGSVKRFFEEISLCAALDDEAAQALRLKELVVATFRSERRTGQLL